MPADMITSHIYESHPAAALGETHLASDGDQRPYHPGTAENQRSAAVRTSDLSCAATAAPASACLQHTTTALAVDESNLPAMPLPAGRIKNHNLPCIGHVSLLPSSYMSRLAVAFCCGDAHPEACRPSSRRRKTAPVAAGCCDRQRPPANTASNPRCSTPRAAACCGEGPDATTYTSIDNIRKQPMQMSFGPTAGLVLQCRLPAADPCCHGPCASASQALLKGLLG